MNPQHARTVTVSHLARVEGHGGIHVRIVGDVVHEVNLDVFEGSRYYEALLKGKHFLEVQGIITRVCAICSASHTVTALSAIEKALGVEPPERVLHLRDLLELGATIESHALHVFALVLPDLLGFESVRHVGEVSRRGGLRAQAQAAREPRPAAHRRPRHPPRQSHGAWRASPSRSSARCKRWSPVRKADRPAGLPGCHPCVGQSAAPPIGETVQNEGRRES